MFRASRSNRLPKRRSAALNVEGMEDRALLSQIGPIATPPAPKLPPYVVPPITPPNTVPPQGVIPPSTTGGLGGH